MKEYESHQKSEKVSRPKAVSSVMRVGLGANSDFDRELCDLKHFTFSLSCYSK
jgi:hypothetical protein